MTQILQRRDKLRRKLRSQQIDALLVTDPTNVTYLTGFTGDDSFFLLTQEREVVLSDPRFTTQLEQECPDLERAIRKPGTSIAEKVVRELRRSKLKSIGIESHAMTVAMHGALEQRLSRTELRPTTDLVESLRIVKDAGEVQAIRQAVDQARRGFDVIRALLRPEMTEKQVADELEAQLRRFGARGFSFPAIVAAGPQAALPHATPGDRLIGEHPFLLIDWGARAGLYVSDLTRLLVTGKIPPKLQRIYEVVLKAKQAGVAAIRPGITCGEVDLAARRVIDEAGFGRRFGHGLGHGIGMEVHEAPRLAKGQQTKLKAGMVVTVEPGIYLPGWGGVRIEDDVLVTRTGHEVLSSLPTELEACVVR